MKVRLSFKDSLFFLLRGQRFDDRNGKLNFYKFILSIIPKRHEKDFYSIISIASGRLRRK